MGRAIDIGGTETVYLDDGFAPNPLLELSPGLELLDRGFNVDVVGTSADHVVDFLDPAVASRLEGRFDLVYCFDTLEHVSDPFRFAEHLVRILKPGGHLYLATVFQWAYHPSPEDYFRFSPIGLLEVFTGPVNVMRGQFDPLWLGWGTDPRGVVILGRRGDARPLDRSSPPIGVPELLGRSPAPMPSSLRRRLRRLAAALR
jgi:SAM-dependent methyltransferase